MNELVSVIVPVYNAQDHLHQCINSIINQTYQYLELILIDDGSLDQSGEICDEFATIDDRIKVFHSENCGVSAARNKGIDNACGTYIVFVDSDDWIDAEFIYKMMKCQCIHKNNLIICGRMVIEKKSTFAYLYQNKPLEQRIEYAGFWKLFSKRMLHAPWGKIYQKDILMKHNLRFQEGISLGEDILFNLEYCYYIDGYVCINQPLYYWNNMLENTLSHKYVKDNFIIQNEIYSKVYKFCFNNNLSKKMNWACFYWDYYKALLYAIDMEYEHVGSLNNIVKNLLLRNEWLTVLKQLESNKSNLSFKQQIELYLIKKNCYKINYKIRKAKLKIKYVLESVLG